MTRYGTASTVSRLQTMSQKTNAAAQWVDEDEQEGNPDDEDFMAKMGGMGGAGGPGGFEGIDFSKLGAGPMGGEEDEGDEEADESDDDDDMPELEGEASGSKSSSKIQEVE